MDFMLVLPEWSGFDAAGTVVDHLSKIQHVVLSPMAIDACELAALFL